MKKINPNDEVNAKILQILDEHENDIIAANKNLMDMNDYNCPYDILEDIDEFNRISSFFQKKLFF